MSEDCGIVPLLEPPGCTVTTVGSCGEDIAALVDFGCVHEHVEAAVPVCARHLDRREVLYCQKCWDLHHACPMFPGSIQPCPVVRVSRPSPSPPA